MNSRRLDQDTRVHLFFPTFFYWLPKFSCILCSFIVNCCQCKSCRSFHIIIFDTLIRFYFFGYFFKFSFIFISSICYFHSLVVTSFFVSFLHSFIFTFICKFLLLFIICYLNSFVVASFHQVLLPFIHFNFIYKFTFILFDTFIHCYFH